MLLTQNTSLDTPLPSTQGGIQFSSSARRKGKINTRRAKTVPRGHSWYRNLTSEENERCQLFYYKVGGMRRDKSTENATMNPALARKRRRQLRAVQRGSQDSDDDSFECPMTPKRDAEDLDEEDYLPESASSSPNPSITGIKKQARYEPGVPMSREQLTAWRKEARRVRNRESAAASRKRTRERIEELESEVSVWQSKYSAALKRIQELEAAVSLKSKGAFTPRVLTPVSTPASPRKIVSPATSAKSTPELTPYLPPADPREFFSLDEKEDVHKEEVEKRYQHIIEMISRPEAKGMIS